MKVGSRKSVPVLLALASPLLLGAGMPDLEFVPLSPRFEPGAEDYARIWEEEGPRIVAALEAASGLSFPDTPVDVIVSNGRPMATYDGRIIRLRATNRGLYRKGTLVHELGHLLAMTLPRGHGLDDHRLLYLFLYDAWTELYGTAFADRMVALERRFPGVYDPAWRWALAQSPEERRSLLDRLREKASAGTATAPAPAS